MASPFDAVIAGAIAGQTSLLVVQPMDFIRTRLQTSAQDQYSGVIDCFKKTLHNEGAASFYRGMLVPFIAQGIYKAVMFSSFQTSSAFFQKRNTAHNNDPTLTPSQLMLCGALSGTINSFVVTPVELIRNNLIVARQSASPTTIPAIVRGAIQQNGLLGMWRGQLSCSIRDFFGVGAYFYGNNRAVYHLKQRTNLPNWAVQICAGMVAGFCFWATALPLDRVKSIIQTQRNENRTIPQIIQTIVQKEGISGLYRGWVVGFGRGIPAATIVFCSYNAVLDLLTKRRQKQTKQQQSHAQ